MRIVWLRAEVVTPRSAARSNRGLITISGVARSPATRGARSSGNPSISVAILFAAAISFTGSSPPRYSITSRDAPPGPPPFWLTKLTRASGMAASEGARARSNCVLVTLRSFLSFSSIEPLPTWMRSNTRSTEGSLSDNVGDPVDHRFGLSSVVPGGKLTWTVEVSRLIGGWKVIGSVAIRTNVRTRQQAGATMPADDQRAGSSSCPICLDGEAIGVGLGRVQRPAEEVQIFIHRAARRVRLDAVQRRKKAAIRGVIIRATSRLISTETTTVKPKALKNWPEIPGINADRQEDCDDRHGGGQHRKADLVGSIERGLVSGFAHAHVANDVLDLDDRIVDQHPCNKAQRQKRKLVEIDIQQVHEPERWDR